MIKKKRSPFCFRLNAFQENSVHTDMLLEYTKENKLDSKDLTLDHIKRAMNQAFNERILFEISEKELIIIQKRVRSVQKKVRKATKRMSLLVEPEEVVPHINDPREDRGTIVDPFPEWLRHNRSKSF